MKAINLLPGWYLQHQRRQKNIRVHAGVMILVGGLMVGATMLARRQSVSLLEQRDQLAARLRQTPDPQAKVDQLRAELKRLEELRRRREELGNTIPMSAVIQQLQNDMPHGVSLSNMLVEVRPEPVPGSGAVGDLRNPPRYHDVARMSVAGISPDGKRIGDFVDLLGKNPLFSDVVISNTRWAELHRYTICHFEIQFNMELGRLTSEAPDTVVASAGPDKSATGVLSDGK